MTKWKMYPKLRDYKDINSLDLKRYLNVPLYHEVKEDGYEATLVSNSGYFRTYDKDGNLSIRPVQIICDKLIRNNEDAVDYLHAGFHFICELIPSVSCWINKSISTLVGLDIRSPTGHYLRRLVKTSIFSRCGIRPIHTFNVIEFKSLTSLHNYVLTYKQIARKLGIVGYVFKIDPAYTDDNLDGFKVEVSYGKEDYRSLHR